MSRKELEKQLGITINDEPETLKAPDIDTPEEPKKPKDIVEKEKQEDGDPEESIKIVNACKEIYTHGRTNDVEWRWHLGKNIELAQDKKKYGTRILKTISEELDIAVCDLSRFHKFHKTFTIDQVKQQASKGYTWSHFKIINDMPDGEVKQRIITVHEEKAEAPKTKELQQEINQEREKAIDGPASTGGASSEPGPVSPLKPVNSALKAIEKLADSLADILIQKDSGMDFDNDKQSKKYDEAISELQTKLAEVVEMKNKLFPG